MPLDAAWSATVQALAAIASLIVLAGLLVVTRQYADATRELARATRRLADETTQSVAELREGRFALFLPMPRWQQPSATAVQGTRPEDQDITYLGVMVYLTNSGPGPARLISKRLDVNTRESFEIVGLAIPSTLPAHERIRLHFSYQSHAFEERERVFTVGLTYTDLPNLRTYETRAVVAAYFRKHPPGSSEARFVDSDERSADERRVSRSSA